MTTETATAEPLDTLAPGTTRRRVWQAPAVQSHSLLTLTLTKLYLAPAGPAPKPETVAAILDGANLEDTFGPLAVAIDLATVRRVKLDLAANTLTLAYDPTRSRVGGSGVVGRTPRTEASIAFADHTTADEVFTKIWRRLGPHIELRRHGAEPGAIRQPLAWVGGVLAATAGLSFASLLAADHPDPPALLAPFAALDWRLVCGLGGALLAGLQVWLYRRMSAPPTALELIAPRERGFPS